MDRISLIGMSFFGRHGVSEEERATGHRFEVDLDIFADLSGIGDDISKTINYKDAFDQVATVIEGKSYRLIESLAEEVAAVVLGNRLVESVTVRVRKVHPPIKGEIDAAEVEISRGN